MRCSIKNINLPPAPTPTHSKRIADPREDAEILKNVQKAEAIRKAQEQMKNVHTKERQRPRVKSRLNNDQRNLVIRMWKDGKQGKEIAEAIGLDVAKTFVVINQLQQRGLIEKRNKYKKVDSGKILQELKTGKTVTQIAKDLDVTRRTVQRKKKEFEEKGEL